MLSHGESTMSDRCIRVQDLFACIRVFFLKNSYSLCIEFMLNHDIYFFFKLTVIEYLFIRTDELYHYWYFIYYIIYRQQLCNQRKKFSHNVEME